MNINDQFSKANDLYSPIEVKARYAICSTPRSGSHYFGHLLKEAGDFGYPLEYFHNEHIEIWTKRKNQSSYTNILDFLESIRTSKSGIFGTKLHFTHLKNLKEHIEIKSFLSSYKLIFITRRDTLSQAVSYSRALQTGSWISGMPEKQTPVYNRDHIMQRLQHIIRCNASWELLSSLYNINIHRVVYEDILNNEQATVESFASFISENNSDFYTSNLTKMPKKQSDNLNKEWKNRFLNEVWEADFNINEIDILKKHQAFQQPQENFIDKLKTLCSHKPTS